MIITLEHEDIEAALIAWMNDKGMAANIGATKITMSKARNTGRITAVIDPNGNSDGPDVALPTLGEGDSADQVEAPDKSLFTS
jgi:hypothetical protein